MFGEGETMAASAVPRRLLLCGCVLGAELSLVRQVRADDASSPDRAKPPQVGDSLVSAGADAGQTPLKPADLDGSDIFIAWGFDPIRKVPRDGSRLNLVLLMRFAGLDNSADGVVAYSAICTHQQCTVSDWLSKEQVAQCPCHQSRYDLRHGAKVVGGPAPRPLPALPLRLADGALQVAGPFSARVGGEQDKQS